MTAQTPHSTQKGPVLFAYDGSEYAKAAIWQAGQQLRKGRRAIVLTVWQPAAAMAFAAAPGLPLLGLDEDLEKRARRVAHEGARLPRSSGFQAEPTAERGDIVWQLIVESAQEHDGPDRALSPTIWFRGVPLDPGIRQTASAPDRVL